MLVLRRTADVRAAQPDRRHSLAGLAERAINHVAGPCLGLKDRRRSRRQENLQELTPLLLMPASCRDIITSCRLS